MKVRGNEHPSFGHPSERGELEGEKELLQERWKG